jgi:hypothetical protein
MRVGSPDTTQREPVVSRQSRALKKTIGAILCLLAVFVIAGTLVGWQSEPPRRKIQSGLLVAVLLTIGISLSTAKAKPSDIAKK